MRIHLVIDTFYPNTGGQQVRFYELLECFLKKGHEVEVITVGHEANLAPKEQLSNGIIVNRIIMDSNYYKNGVFGRRLSTYIKFSIKSKQYLKRNNVDIVIFDQFSFLSAIIYKSKKTFTILDFVEFRKSLIWKLINKKLLRSTDKIVCISKYLKDEVDHYLKNNIRTEVIPSLVRTEKYYKSSHSENFGLFLGRVEPHKHPESAISAVSEYNNQNNSNLKLVIAGGGSILENLKTKYQDNQMVTFLGYVDDDVKYDLLSKAKFLILPSEREGLPKSFIEAIASKLPIITINYPENYGRYFVRDNKVGEIANSDKELYREIGKVIEGRIKYENNCSLIVNNYNLITGAEKYLTLYKK